MFYEFIGIVPSSSDSIDHRSQPRIISDPEENPKILSRDSGDKDDQIVKEDTQKKGLSINEAMDDSVILKTEENPYYEGLRTSHLKVKITLKIQCWT